ncbi:MAG: hypothetical protein HY900_01130 [Deltaproteobacteria bacterium]|nr:hypothetical protein [Deltaproteobacteria bacterium]
MRLPLLTIALCLSLAAPVFAGQPTTKKTESKHGPKDAKPGSYEDWCEEHGVPESLDTRCNPALIPAFKATKDWCEKHGLPMSQCLKDNPKLKIVRPPKPAGAK